MCGDLIQIEVLCFAVRTGSDDVPASTATTEMVEGSKPAGDVVRLVEAGGNGSDQPEMAVTKALVEALGGSIAVSSSLGKGTTISLTWKKFPAAKLPGPLQ